MFGSNDKPVEEDGDDFQGHDLGDAVHAVINRRPRRTTSGDDQDAQAGWRLRNWRRHAGAESPSAAVGSDSGSGGRHMRSQTSFRGFFNRNKKSGINLEAGLDEELAQLDEEGGAGGGGGSGSGGNNHRRAATSAAPRLPPRGSRAAPRPSPVRPLGIPADSAEAGIVDLGDIQGGKLKAAVKRAMIATRQEKEAAARRGRQKKRQEQELGDFNGYIQVKDPALDKVCVEYGLTADLAESKYR